MAVTGSYIDPEGTTWAEPVKTLSFPSRLTANRSNRRARRPRPMTARTATSPPRNATATARTISRCSIELTEIFALDPPDAGNIEQMCAPAALGEIIRQLWGEQQ